MNNMWRSAKPKVLHDATSKENIAVEYKDISIHVAGRPIKVGEKYARGYRVNSRCMCTIRFKNIIAELISATDYITFKIEDGKIYFREANSKEDGFFLHEAGKPGYPRQYKFIRFAVGTCPDIPYEEIVGTYDIHYDDYNFLNYIDLSERVPIYGELLRDQR